MCYASHSLKELLAYFVQVWSHFAAIRYTRSSWRFVVRLLVSRNSVQWNPHFTDERKQISARTFHVHYSIWVKSGTKQLHKIFLSIFNFQHLHLNLIYIYICSCIIIIIISPTRFGAICTIFRGLQPSLFWILPSSGLLCSVGWLSTDVSEPIGCPKASMLNQVTFRYGADRLPRNVGA